MKVLVIGSTGKLGQEILAVAGERDIEAVALARNPKAVPAHGHVTSVQGDVLDRGSLVRAMSGVDAVISAFGSRTVHSHEVYTAGIENVLAAMKEANVNRLIAVSSAAADDKALGFFYAKIIKPLFFKTLFDDIEGMEKKIMASGAGWTIVRLTRIVEGKGSGYKITEEVPPVRDWKIPRVAAAHCVLDQLKQDTYFRKAITVIG